MARRVTHATRLLAVYVRLLLLLLAAHALLPMPAHANQITNHLYEEQEYAEFKSDSIGITKVIDLNTGTVAYKDHILKSCFIEKISMQSVWDKDRVLIIHPKLLTNQQVLTIAGPIVSNFCFGWPAKILRSPTNTEIRKKRSNPHYFVGRKTRGQTQSQYLNFDGAAEPGKAEAEATNQGTKAVVYGTRGMGQAQSQNGPFNCADCFGTGGISPSLSQAQVPGALQIGRPGDTTQSRGQIGVTGTPGLQLDASKLQQPTGPGTEGQQRYPDVSGRPIYGPDGRIIGYEQQSPVQTPGKPIYGPDGRIIGYEQTGGSPTEHRQHTGKPIYGPDGRIIGYAQPGETIPDHTGKPIYGTDGKIIRYEQPGGTSIGQTSGRQSYGPDGRLIGHEQFGQPGTNQGQTGKPIFGPDGRIIGYDQQSPQGPADLGQIGISSQPPGQSQSQPHGRVDGQIPGTFDGLGRTPVYGPDGRLIAPGDRDRGDQPGETDITGSPAPGQFFDQGGLQKPSSRPSYPGDTERISPSGAIPGGVPAQAGQTTYFIPGGSRIRPGSPDTDYLPGSGHAHLGPDGQQSGTTGADGHQVGSGTQGGRFSGQLSGQYHSNVGQRGQFSGSFEGKYNARDGASQVIYDGSLPGEDTTRTSTGNIHPGSYVPSTVQHTLPGQIGSQTFGVQQPGAGNYVPGTQVSGGQQLPGSQQTGGFQQPTGSQQPHSQQTDLRQPGTPPSSLYPGIYQPGQQPGIHQTGYQQPGGFPTTTYQDGSGQTGYQHPSTQYVGGQQPSFQTQEGSQSPSRHQFPNGQQPGFLTHGAQGSQKPGFQISQQPGYQGGQQPGYLPGQRPGYQGAQQPTYQNGQQQGYPGGQQPGIYTGQQPDYQTPGSQQSGYQTPSSQQPGYQTVGQQPGYQTPGSQQPGYQTPGSQQPGYQTPGSQQPAYQTPGSQQPGYQTPSGQQIATQQPRVQQPSTQYDGQRAGTGYQPGTDLSGSRQQGGSGVQYPDGHTLGGQFPGQQYGPVLTGVPQGGIIYGPDGRIISTEGQAPGNLITGAAQQDATGPDDSDSQAQSAIQRVNNETQASASSSGRYTGGTAQSQVSGSYAGSGSFSASAGTNDGLRGAQTQVSGNQEGALSSAQGRGGKGQSQAQVQLSAETGDTQSTAQSSGLNHGTNTQVQSGIKGGMADAQANGPGATSSQAQIGFVPYDATTNEDDPQNPHNGGGSASASSGTHAGKSQVQINGKYAFGIRYTGQAQASSANVGHTATDIVLPTMKPIDFSQNKYAMPVKQEAQRTANVRQADDAKILRIVPSSTTPSTDDSEYDEDYEDPEGEDAAQKNLLEQQQTRSISHDMLDPLEDIDEPEMPVPQLKHGDIIPPGQVIPGSNGYTIPTGFRGRVTEEPQIGAGGNTKRVMYAVGANANRHSTHDGVGFGSGFSYQPTYAPVQYGFKSKSFPPKFVSVTKSETGSKNLLTGRKTPSVYYTQSSTCGYFTNTCVYSNGKKICLPKPKANPDGSPIACRN